MADIGTFLDAWFEQDTDVTAILGSSPVMLFPGTVPQKYRERFPRGVYQQIGEEDISGTTGHGGEMLQVDYQLQFADRGTGGYKRLRTLRNAVRGTGTDPGRKLHYYSGVLGGVTVDKAELQNVIDNATPPEDASADTIYELWLDFRFWYER